MIPGRVIDEDEEIYTGFHDLFGRMLCWKNWELVFSDNIKLSPVIFGSNDNEEITVLISGNVSLNDFVSELMSDYLRLDYLPVPKGVLAFIRMVDEDLVTPVQYVNSGDKYILRL